MGTQTLQPPQATTRVTVEQFAQDLWEAVRTDIREQLGDAMDNDVFERDIPRWDHLPEATRHAKVRATREEMLRLLDRAGYEVRKKVK